MRERAKTPHEFRDGLWDAANDYDKVVAPIITTANDLIAAIYRDIERGEVDADSLTAHYAGTLREKLAG